MKFIMLSGHSCGGKSTVVKRLMEEREHLYQLSPDSQKWLFSKYDRSVHREDVHVVMRAIAEAVCGMKYDIISDSGLFRETREKMLEIPSAHGYDVVEINLEASWDTLGKRFDERLERAKNFPERKISNTSKEVFKEIYDIYEREKNPSAITLRTDEQDIEAVVTKVLEIISR